MPSFNRLNQPMLLGFAAFNRNERHYGVSLLYQKKLLAVAQPLFIIELYTCRLVLLVVDKDSHLRRKRRIFLSRLVHGKGVVLKGRTAGFVASAAFASANKAVVQKIVGQRDASDKIPIAASTVAAG